MGACVSTQSEYRNVDNSIANIEQRYPLLEFIVIDGYLRRYGIVVPLDILQLLDAFYGSIPMLVVGRNEKKELRADHVHIFSSVIIEEGATLTVNPWDPEKQEGGKLIIRCLQKLEVKKGGKIEVDNCGYKGGKKEIYSYWTGESFNRPSIQQNKNNLGGGGGGGYRKSGGVGEHIEPGGGGGYGTKGGGKNGGQTYGHKELRVLMLGSGGGPGILQGGSGGGAIKLLAEEMIINGSISANGE
eukprot:525385_1